MKDINNNKYQFVDENDEIEENSTVWALYMDEKWYKAKVIKIQNHEAGNIYHVVYDGYGETVYQLGRDSIYITT